MREDVNKGDSEPNPAASPYAETLTIELEQPKFQSQADVVLPTTVDELDAQFPLYERKPQYWGEAFIGISTVMTIVALVVGLTDGNTAPVIDGCFMRLSRVLQRSSLALERCLIMRSWRV